MNSMILGLDCLLAVGLVIAIWRSIFRRSRSSRWSGRSNDDVGAGDGGIWWDSGSHHGHHHGGSDDGGHGGGDAGGGDAGGGDGGGGH